MRRFDAQLNDALEPLPLGVAVLDARGRIMARNSAFAVTVDCDCPAGEPLSERIAVAADRPALRSAIDDALDGVGLPAEVRIRIPARPDVPLVVTVSGTPNGIGALIVAVRDIREQLRLERQVAQATRMQAIGQLAGGVAHDFNNILTANVGLVEELLERHPKGDGDYDLLAEMRGNNARGAKLVAQLLAFARQQTLRLQLVDAGAAIEEVATLLRRLIGDGITLTLDLDPAAGLINVDPGQLEQVIVNLAVNARDAMSNGGRLDIITRRVAAGEVRALGHAVMPVDDYVQIAVCDTGTGIPQELAAKIFEPFFTTKESGKGTGLGLSTVYGIVKQSGGFVFNAPGPESGTVFKLFFPLAGEAEREALPPPPPVFAPPARRGDVHVLLVEDDRAVRVVLHRALKAAGYAVTEAVDAIAALPFVEDLGVRIDVLVSDVMMPGMDGPELAARARACRPGLPVVLMSGYAEPPQREAAADPGTTFLAKPFGAAALIAAIEATLARTG